MSGREREKMKLQPAVKKETAYIAAATLAGSAVMVVVFAILHAAFPGWAPFDLTVFTGAAGGSIVAVANFLWMGITVQKITAMDETDGDRAKNTMALSLRFRMLMQIIWVIIAVTVPFINMVSGIVPLFIPGTAIKLRGIAEAGRGGQ